MSEIKLSIKDGREAFYQWDTGVAVLVDKIPPGMSVPKMHFARRYDTEAIPVTGVETIKGATFYVPDEILQKATPFTAYLYVREGAVADTFWTEVSREFDVLPRPKPANYVYTPTQAHTVEAIVSGAVDEAMQERKLDADALTKTTAGLIGEATVNGAALEPFGQVHLTSDGLGTLRPNNVSLVEIDRLRITEDATDGAFFRLAHRCASLSWVRVYARHNPSYIGFRFDLHSSTGSFDENNLSKLPVDYISLDLGLKESPDDFLRVHMSRGGDHEVHVGTYSPPGERLDSCIAAYSLSQNSMMVLLDRAKLESYAGGKFDKIYFRFYLSTYAGGQEICYGFKGGKFVQTYHSALDGHFPHVLHLPD